MSIVTSIKEFFGYGCAVKAEHSEIFMSGVRFAQETGLGPKQESIAEIEPLTMERIKNENQLIQAHCEALEIDASMDNEAIADWRDTLQELNPETVAEMADISVSRSRKALNPWKMPSHD